MTVSPYDPEQHYPAIVQWWEGHRVPVTPIACIPRLGAIIEENGDPVFAAWSSMDNSTGLAFLLWPVSRPGTPPSTVSRALRMAVSYLLTALSSFGYHTLLSATHTPSMARALARLGFTPIGDPVILQSIAV